MPRQELCALRDGMGDRAITGEGANEIKRSRIIESRQDFRKRIIAVMGQMFTMIEKAFPATGGSENVLL